MTTLITCPWFTSAAAFVIGACLGRLANRAIDVFPRHESLDDQLRRVWTFAPHENVLRKARSWWHWLPVVGWLSPGNPLAATGHAWRYALVELGNGLILALLAFSRTPADVAVGFNGGMFVVPIPFGVAGWEILAPPADVYLGMFRFLLHAMLVEALLIASVIDLRWMIIPDGSTIPPMLLAVFISGVVGGAWLVPVWYEHTGIVAALSGTPRMGFGEIAVPEWITSSPHLHGLAVSLLGLIVGGGTVWAVRIVGQWALGREAMGFGDVVLMALVGSVVGWQPVLVVFFLAPVCAIVVVCFSFLTGKAREFPYGPWLSLATVLLLVAWRWIWPSAGQFFLLGRFVPIFGVGCLVLLAVLLRAMRLMRGEEAYLDHGRYWTSADQLHYQSQEHPEPTRNSWRDRQDSQWPGLDSARGRHGQRLWRGPSQPHR